MSSVSDLMDTNLKRSRPRIMIAEHISAMGERHFSAEQLHQELLAAGQEVSLATVYNTLHRFCRAGIVRVLPIAGKRAYFDTNTSDHQHFYIENEDRIIDIATAWPIIDTLPKTPRNMEVVGIDVVIRLRKRSGD